ncbi:MAG: flavin reductase family protein [Bacteroidota bacterium]
MPLKTFHHDDIQRFDKRYRSHFINCVSGIKSMNLIGTKNDNGQTNLAIFSSVIHLGSHPPLVGFIQRPTSVDRHTYDNIVETSFYTINAVTEERSMQAHQTSARYNREESEFDETSIEHEFIDDFYAPYVKNTPLKMGLQLEDIIDIPANDTKMIIGKIQYVHVDEVLLGEDGHIHLDDAPVLGGVGLDTYVKTSKHGRYSYAKPDQILKKL